MARICREAGGRVSTNVHLRDLDLHAPIAADGRRLEVAVDRLPLFRAAHNEGVAISMAERRKERRYPELVGRRARSRLVVLAVEVGGKWSPTTQHFTSGLARARARCEGLLLRRRAEQAWRLRWDTLLSCTAARAVADTFLELPGSVGADGDTPASHEVERDFAFAGLAL